MNLDIEKIKAAFKQWLQSADSDGEVNFANMFKAGSAARTIAFYAGYKAALEAYDHDAIRHCPSCGCAVDENLAGHHSAADCAILKYAERHYDAIRLECAEAAVQWCEQYEGFMPGNDDIELRAAIMGAGKE